MLQGCGVLDMFTSKCAWGHNTPQRRALFRPLNFQKRSKPGVLCILTSNCAWRHNGVPFFIFHLASWLRTRRFSEPTFRPSGPSSASRLSYLSAHLHLLSSDFLHLTFPTSDLLTSGFLPVLASSWLCVSICPNYREFSFQTSFD